MFLPADFDINKAIRDECIDPFVPTLNPRQGSNTFSLGCNCNGRASPKKAVVEYAGGMVHSLGLSNWAQ